MGGSQATQLAPACCECRSRRLRTGTSRTRYASTDNYEEDHGRPFKRRATPDPNPSQGGSGQNARTAKRPRRSAKQASERSGGGPHRRRDTDGLNSGTIPEQQPQHSYESWNVGSAQPPEPAVSGARHEATPRAQADVHAEDDESDVLR